MKVAARKYRYYRRGVAAMALERAERRRLEKRKARGRTWGNGRERPKTGRSSVVTYYWRGGRV